MASEAERYFEDFVPGSVHEFGPVVVDEAEIIEFARQYDPQPIHTDPEWARTGPFGGLIASGWHTAAIAMRLLVDQYLPPAASLASPGIDELRWLRPVRPGDELRVRVTVIEARPSRSKPDRGLLRSRIEVLEGDGSAVMTMTGLNLIRRRPGATG
ncbi:MAG TPA: MaoC family dehydratase [Streptosporangiaceae bacterium]|nr:MaoC family dehydratase [Streptosporangiaceae bacterium]